MISKDTIWFDCASESDNKPELEEMIEAGVPAQDAEGVASLAGIVGACGAEPLSDPLTLFRFYVSSQRDVELAAKSYWMSLKWRSEFHLNLVMAMHGAGETYSSDGSPSHLIREAEWHWEQRICSYEAEYAKRYAFWGRLKDPNGGGPVLLWRAGVADIDALHKGNRVLLDPLKRAIAAHLEDCFQESRAASLRNKRLVLSHLVIDAFGLGLVFIQRLEIIKELVEFGLHYPEAVATVTVIRAPWLVTRLFQMGKVFLPKATQVKFAILGNDFARGLKLHSGLDLSMFPQYLGGQTSNDVLCSCNHVPDVIKAAAALRETWGFYPGFPTWFSSLEQLKAAREREKAWRPQ